MGISDYKSDDSLFENGEGTSYLSSMTIVIHSHPLDDVVDELWRLYKKSWFKKKHYKKLFDITYGIVLKDLEFKEED